VVNILFNGSKLAINNIHPQKIKGLGCVFML
jgi:hypothetical protein